MMFVILFSSLFASASLTSAAAVDAGSVAQRLRTELAPHLSRHDLISTEAPPRWSSFNAPHPAVVVNVETESDVAITVKYCTSKDIPFLAQNGGSGWATTFDLGPNGVLVNLARLNQVTFNADKTQATIGGGSNISNTIAHSYAAGALIETGNCNCAGTLGAILGGGYGNLMGLYGFGVDNILSLRVVTADGQLRDVTASSYPDLFWGLRGAGPNLGIVTSAVVKSYPATEKDMEAWTGSLVFSPDKLEEVVQAIQDLELQSDMNIFMYFISGGLPANEPAIVTTPFLYKGNVTSGRAAFASLYAIGPETDNTAVIPYNQWNAGGDAFCSFGGRKPSYGAGFQNMVPKTWRETWNEYVEFQKKPTAENSVVLLEAYSLTKARSVDPNSASFPYRNVNFNAVAIPWYNDTSLDSEAQSFGNAARDLWRATDGLAQTSTYINFAHGDEDLQVVYGSSLSKLQSIKHHYDPKDQFRQWFNIN
ncbi:FAD binding domain-containing protein [Daldinia caldariorum]|uniref:FAD binding domain-containing protein n=1 Tax=Daldinia caldariorum TaxID=326644 RepID=UPI0020077455|nr:FAD binding domain-containing protein [Daldinia caldariorum]KAI1465028.1 FAD binding domain-containing protein [Daldinia caldariorum]